MDLMTILSFFNRLQSGKALVGEVIKDGFVIANNFVEDGTHKNTLKMWEQKLIDDEELAVQTLISLGKGLQRVGEFLQSLQPAPVTPITLTAPTEASVNGIGTSVPHDSPIPITIINTTKQPVEVAVTSPQL